MTKNKAKRQHKAMRKLDRGRWPPTWLKRRQTERVWWKTTRRQLNLPGIE